MSQGAIRDNVLNWLQNADAAVHSTGSTDISTVYSKIAYPNKTGGASFSSGSDYIYFQIKKGYATPTFWSGSGSSDPSKFIQTYFNLEEIISGSNPLMYQQIGDLGESITSKMPYAFNKNKTLKPMSDASISTLQTMITSAGYASIIDTEYVPPTGTETVVNTNDNNSKITVNPDGTVTDNTLKDLQTAQSNQAKIEEYLTIGGVSVTVLILMIKLLQLIK
jgi:hypothetical protein